jgi:hypothetical protein
MPLPLLLNLNVALVCDITGKYKLGKGNQGGLPG